MELTILKLGGSLLTDKARDCTFAQQQAQRLAREIACFGEPLVLLHGTGSFGKPPARWYGYLDGFLPPARVRTVSEVEALLDDLRAQVLTTLRAAGVAACGLSAAALFDTREGALSRCAQWPVRRLYERGLTAVISGALVADRSRGFAVCSSDAMASRLAVLLRARRLLFATDAPGVVQRRQGEAVLLTEVTEAALTQASPAEGDVTGGMDGKLKAGFEAARAGVRTLILDGRIPGRLLQALRGEEVPATRLLSDPPSPHPRPAQEANGCAG